MTKVRKMEHSAKKSDEPPTRPALLVQMAERSYAPVFDQEEFIRLQWEETVKPLCPSQLRVAAINYNIWRSRFLNQQKPAA